MTRATVDGNEAAVSVAYRLNEVCCIYPITPSSPMAELADEWATAGRPNIWGSVPAVAEMQSEGGAAGALHGALQSGALTTTFTASQGLLLMIPNMYKIAGELTPTVLHVAARSLAAQGLSIFGDHSDVMAVRQTGFALLASASVQEAHDLALAAQAATLATRVPFVHFFDGFRTSHELYTIEMLNDGDLHALVPAGLVRAHRERALSPDRPFIRGTAQNPDVYFQARETVNPFYARVPAAVQEAMDALGERTGRRYRLMEYHGHPLAERVIVLMGSGAQTAARTAGHLAAGGEKVGVVQVRLYRPFPAQALLAALPASARRVAVLDRTKEPGSLGEPLFLDVLVALAEAHAAGGREVMPTVTGGRYGLSSKEFTPGMAAGVFAELARDQPRPRFTVGIAEFGLGFRLAADLHLGLARSRLTELREEIGPDLVEAILDAPQRRESEFAAQRERVAELRRRLDRLDADNVPGGEAARAADLRSVLDHLVRRSVWLVGGDGWAYDIGAGGLDHVLASGRDVNVLVLDTEVYSNTGGQMSKATPLGAVAKFATGGKTVPKKDLALQAIAYGTVYVARVAMGADPQQTLRALREAEAYPGPSLVIAYSHCIAHGIEMRNGMDQQYRAVASGYWPLMRYDPAVRAEGGNPFLLDSPRPRIALSDYTGRELRYRILAQADPAEAERLLGLAQQEVNRRWATYEDMATQGAERFPPSAHRSNG
jgi:pyruvate/2-oxoacid:ferredoxin oxidoreductase alpha subunit/pyruvate/2-oxoacid:ferredoxin oxidoreductase beta subunit